MTDHTIPRADIELRRETTDTWVDVLGPVGDLAGKLARTQFVPRAMQGNSAAVAAAILTGRELGLGPMTALRGIDVIEGKPSLTASMIAARILAAGHRIEWKASTDDRCTVRIERGDGLSEAEVTWTMKDAQRAGLAGKKVWQSYPRTMLRHRALTEAAGMACPDVALGLEAAELDTEQRPPMRTAVQIAPEAPQGPPEPRTAPEPQPEPQNAAESPQETPAEPMVDPATLRQINARLTDWEKLEGRKLDRAERRRMIGFMAGVDDPDSLNSAKDLTLAQAKNASAALLAEIQQMETAPVQGEIVEAEVVED